MEFIISSCSDIGTLKTVNQDSHFVTVLSTCIGKVVFAILCDGMGGLQKGEVASASVVHAFCEWVRMDFPTLLQNGLQEHVIKQEWFRIVREYNEKIKNYGIYNNVQLGTTVTAMLLTPTNYYILNVGDTRAYEMYDDVVQLSKDQSVVAREVELGHISKEQAKTDPRRSVLLQCVGASEQVEPEFICAQTKQHATYMLCSDGFIHEISDEEIYEYLQPNAMLNETMMQTNMQSLVTLNKQRKERDNISVITIRTF